MWNIWKNYRNQNFIRVKPNKKFSKKHSIRIKNVLRERRFRNGRYKYRY
ncbi:hypothetical protein HMPREF9015_02298 [Leptotrichia wadei F0279]|uniref:Uncharacterized protein n=1 Tax=Leptotrichia wadei (strain F0279) TaxID=888055 RepID=U2RAR8_LEPWF|nr:hypothetical protein HMPREF9015_02298 [Leptotrichia wadei F0279]